MGTFKEETDRIIEVLKRAKEMKSFTDDVFSCEYIPLLDPRALHPRDNFDLKYRGLNFSFMVGNAWNTPLFRDELPNARQRWELYLLTRFLALKKVTLKRKEFRREAQVAITRFLEGNFSDYLTEILTEEKDIYSGWGPDADLNLRLNFHIINQLGGDVFNPKALRILRIPDEYDQLFSTLENLLLKDFPDELKKINDSLHVINPRFRYTPLKVGSLDPEEEDILIDLVIFLPENWEQEEPTLFQLQMGAILYQRGKLTEEEKNELTHLAHQAFGGRIDGLSLVTALKGDKTKVVGFRGSATPRGILAYIRKVAKNKNVKQLLPMVEWVRLPEEEETEGVEWVEEEQFGVPKPKNLYRKPRKKRRLPRNEYASLLEVADELWDTFPGRMKSREVWRAWLYRQISAGRLQAVQLEKEYKLSDNVSYVAKHYFLTPDEVERAIKLYEQQEEQFAQKERRAELIKELAKAKNVGIRQAQKIAKGKTDEELARYLEELKGGQDEGS
jgi:hypothetical protein